MKSLSVLLITVFFSSMSQLSAVILTVDNNAGSVAQFTTVAAAYAAADNGDTILIAGSATDYGGLNCYKDLTFIGAGYMLAANAIPGLNNNPSTVSITIKKDGLNGDGSGTSIIGITGNLNSDPGTTNVLIDKCYNTSWNWRFQGQVTVKRTFSIYDIRLDAANSTISNTLTGSINLAQTNTTVNHCVVTSRIDALPGTSVSNTIFVLATIDLDASYTFCMAVGNSNLPAGGGNINGQLATNVFTQAGGNVAIDAYYQLKANSTAKGTGQNGVDMGAFSGTLPSDTYVLSGLPGVPRITRYTVPSVATGLTALEFEVEAQAFAE